jgi:uncharacterized membrane protein YfcA
VAALMTGRRRKQARSGSAGGATSVTIAEPVLRWRPAFTCDCPRAARIVLTATGVGLLTGFFGVGGGFAVVPALVLALGLSMPMAVGTSLLVISMNSFTALLFRAGQAVTVDWWVIGGFTLSAVIGSLLGSRVVSRVSPARLNVAFTELLVVVALYTAARSFPLVF